MAVSNYDPGQELSSIDFSAVIGGPLTAVVEAQSTAAMSTVDFIKSVGFTPDYTNDDGEIIPGSPIYVSFKYPKLVQPYQPSVRGVIEAITITDGGTGYVEGDTLLINPGEDFTAFDAQYNPAKLTWASGLTGYANESSVATTGGTGTGMTVDITVNGAGEIINVEVNTPGSGYVDGDSLTIDPNTGANFTIEYSSHKLVWDPTLSGYENVSDIEVTGGSGTGMKVAITVNDNAAIPAVFQEMQLEVPILTMLPIPLVRVEEGEINFNAKITSTEFQDVSSRLTLGASFGLSRTSSTAVDKRRKRKVVSRRRSTSINFKASVSYQKSVRSGHKIDKTYHLGVRVKFGSDELPEGMDKLLGILEDAIVSTPVE